LRGRDKSFVRRLVKNPDVPLSGGAGGVPAGGSADQALTKIDATDYNTDWSTIDKTFVGLGNVDNTSDVNKPVSTSQQTAIDAKVANTITNGVTTVAPAQDAVFDALALKADLASPVLTGVPTAPTAAPGTDTTQLATTEFVTDAISVISLTPGPQGETGATGGQGSPGISTVLLLEQEKEFYAPSEPNLYLGDPVFSAGNLFAKENLFIKESLYG
jgi:hypothetical protein